MKWYIVFVKWAIYAALFPIVVGLLTILTEYFRSNMLDVMPIMEVAVIIVFCAIIGGVFGISFGLHSTITAKSTATDLKNIVDSMHGFGYRVAKKDGTSIVLTK